MKLNARELRDIEEDAAVSELRALTRKPIYFILENIYDTYNIGGIFRLADAVAASKIYICGQTEIPPNSKIKKASIGTYKVVPWEYKKTAAEAIAELRTGVGAGSSGPHTGEETSPLRNHDRRHPRKNDGSHPITIIAVEQDTRAVEYTKLDYSFPIALVMGNESYGVLPETLNLADHIAEIPMWGINKSLNVIVSTAIVTYYALSRQ